MNIATFTAKPGEVVIQTGTVQSQEYDGNTTKLKYTFLVSVVSNILARICIATSTAKSCYYQPLFTPDLGRWDGNQDVNLTGS